MVQIGGLIQQLANEPAMQRTCWIRKTMVFHIRCKYQQEITGHLISSLLPVDAKKDYAPREQINGLVRCVWAHFLHERRHSNEQFNQVILDTHISMFLGYLILHCTAYTHTFTAVPYPNPKGYPLLYGHIATPLASHRQALTNESGVVFVSDTPKDPLEAG
jgi:hypothetical protein